MWSDFEADVLEGRYPLEKLVRTEGRCAWYESRSGDKPVLISLTESLNDEVTLLERLKAAGKVHQQNVAEIFESGATVLQETPLVYAVMEFTEENLDDVLRVRALSADETRQVADGLIAALTAIHKERLVCGRVEAANVLAAGDTIKLRSDHLQVVAASENLNAQTAKDIQGLGGLLYQCLTQRRPGAIDSNDPSLQLLPAPFVQVVRRALSGLATLDELSALLHSQATTPKAAASNIAPPVAVKSVSPQPAAAAIPAKKTPAIVDTPPDSSRSPLILGGVVVLLLIVALGLWMILRPSKSTSTSTEEAPRKVVVVPATPPPSTPAAPKPTPAPARIKTPARAASAPVPALSPVVSAAATGESSIWRVIAYTYNHEDQAQHKVETIQAKYPDLKPEVFSAKGHAPYLVGLGGGMEHDAAAQFRQNAIREGMPHDTYIQNYSH